MYLTKLDPRHLYCPFLVLVTSHCIWQIQNVFVSTRSFGGLLLLKFWLTFKICFHSGVFNFHYVLGGLFDAVFVKFLHNPFGVYEHLSHAKPIFLTVEGKPQNR